MSTMIQRIRGFIKSEDGPTAVEYAIMVALIAVVIIGTVQTLGTSINSKFTEVNTGIAGGGGGG